MGVMALRTLTRGHKIHLRCFETINRRGKQKKNAFMLHISTQRLFVFEVTEYFDFFGKNIVVKQGQRSVFDWTRTQLMTGICKQIFCFHNFKLVQEIRWYMHFHLKVSKHFSKKFLSSGIWKETQPERFVIVWHLFPLTYCCLGNNVLQHQPTQSLLFPAEQAKLAGSTTAAVTRRASYITMLTPPLQPSL